MGSSKQPSTSTTINSSSSTTPSPTQEAYNQLLLNRESSLDPQIRDVQSQGLSLSSQLLQGQGLPGYLGDLTGGISPAITQDIVNQSLRDIQPSMQKYGLLDSGVNAAISARTAADVRTQSAQFNQQQLMQLLNQALGGQAQVQQPIVGFSSNLSNNLRGLTSSSSTSTQNQSGGSGNPFLSSLGTGLGIFGGSGGFKF